MLDANKLAYGVKLVTLAGEIVRFAGQLAYEHPRTKFLVKCTDGSHRHEWADELRLDVEAVEPIPAPEPESK